MQREVERYRGDWAAPTDKERVYLRLLHVLLLLYQMPHARGFEPHDLWYAEHHRSITRLEAEVRGYQDEINGPIHAHALAASTTPTPTPTPTPYTIPAPAARAAREANPPQPTLQDVQSAAMASHLRIPDDGDLLALTRPRAVGSTHILLAPVVVPGVRRRTDPRTRRGRWWWPHPRPHRHRHRHHHRHHLRAPPFSRPVRSLRAAPPMHPSTAS